MSSRKTLKKILGVAVVACLALALVGCGNNNAEQNDSANSDDKIIKVGASPAPHAEILEQIKGDLEADGYTLEIVEYSDYIQPNVALNDGILDANYFQHITYLEDYNEENNTNLVSAGDIHFEPLGIYAGKTASLSDLEDGAEISVPSDNTNEARALLLLEAEGLIKLREGAGIAATVNDIEENPKNLTIREVEAAAVARTLEDVDAGVINGNYAISAGLDTKDALANEEVGSVAATKYVNVVAVKAGEESSDKIKALVTALKSNKVKTFIDSSYDGAVVVVG